MGNHWTDYTPDEAHEIGLDLSAPSSAHIFAPLNEDGERCPWPWYPQKMQGAALGMFHCPYCGAMVLGGQPHLDYGDGTDD